MIIDLLKAYCCFRFIFCSFAHESAICILRVLSSAGMSCSLDEIDLTLSLLPNSAMFSTFGSKYFSCAGMDILLKMQICYALQSTFLKKKFSLRCSCINILSFWLLFFCAGLKSSL